MLYPRRHFVKMYGANLHIAHVASIEHTKVGDISGSAPGGKNSPRGIQ